MPEAWRLSKSKYLSSAWDGEGARKFGGRWNSVGVAVVYTSATLSLTLVETLVHLRVGVLPAFSAIPIGFDEALVITLGPDDLPLNWKDHPPPPETQAIGDRWVRDGKSPVLRVPSVVVPHEFNYVLDPRHPEFRRITIGAAIPFPFDSRIPLPADR